MFSEAYPSERVRDSQSLIVHTSIIRQRGAKKVTTLSTPITIIPIITAPKMLQYNAIVMK